MAKYDREFLVPYLQDICTLYLSKDKLSTKIQNCNWEIQTIEQTARKRVPYPELEPPASDKTGFGVGCLGFILSSVALILLISIIGAIFGLILLIPGIMCLSDFTSAKDRENQKIEKRNQEKIRDWNEKVAVALDSEESRIREVRQNIEFYNSEIQRIDKLLEKVYSVNIIPGWYREKYPAIYLYDWFSKSRADDLEHALSMFVLEEIKERLDEIIRLESESILNQRIMIANQYKAMEQQERHNAMLCAKLDRIAASNEERNMYLGMIEANTAANAYFSAADYLRK